MDTKSSTPGERLMEARKSLNMSQSVLGDAVGVEQATISQMERNGSPVSTKVLVSMKESFDINPNWILFGEGSMKFSTADISLKKPLIITVNPDGSVDTK